MRLARRRANVGVERVPGRRVGRHPPGAEQGRIADEAGGKRDLERIERREGGDVVPAEHQHAAAAKHRERGAQRLGEVVALVDAEAVDAIADDGVDARRRQVLPNNGLVLQETPSRSKRFAARTSVRDAASESQSVEPLPFNNNALP